MAQQKAKSKSEVPTVIDWLTDWLMVMHGGGTAHLLVDRSACVHDCPPLRHSNENSVCVDCDGPCPKGASIAHSMQTPF